MGAEGSLRVEANGNTLLTIYKKSISPVENEPPLRRSSLVNFQGES